MKKLIVATALFSVMTGCLADDITIRICDSKNRQECTFGTYGAAAVKLAEREAITKSNTMLPTTVDTTEEKSDFEIKEEKPKELPAGVKVAHLLTGGLSTKIMSFVGED